ncbi:MAG: cytochrome c oxidase, cbb3-type, subunit [Pseudomonadota bacterium]|jgi:caa(3)-type oxidase subunit IV
MSGHDSHAHAGGHDEHEHKPTSMSTYLGVAAVLTVLTIIEIGPLFEWYNLGVAPLLVLSVVKFALVVFIFMHLGPDEPIYKKIFVPSLLLAGLMVTVMMLLFGSFTRAEQMAYKGPVLGYVAAPPPKVETPEGEAGSGAAAGAEQVAAAPAVDGAEVFKTNCVACHGPEAKGGVGPNLTDAEWKNGGGTLADIEATINNGVAGTAMISWTPLLGAEKVKAVSAYVHSLGGGK